MNILCIPWQNPHCKSLKVSVNEMKALPFYLAINPKFTFQCRSRDRNNNEVLVKTGVKNTRILWCLKIARDSWSPISNMAKLLCSATPTSLYLLIYICVCVFVCVFIISMDLNEFSAAKTDKPTNPQNSYGFNDFCYDTVLYGINF